jgi:hypothetical protein
VTWLVMFILAAMWAAALAPPLVQSCRFWRPLWAARRSLDDVPMPAPAVLRLRPKIVDWEALGWA